jgi:hypothetical protein
MSNVIMPVLKVDAGSFSVDESIGTFWQTLVSARIFSLQSHCWLLEKSHFTPAKQLIRAEL